MATPLPFDRIPPGDDLGLGLRSAATRWVNKDGTFNVRRVGLPWFRPYEMYHRLITMGGAPFLGLLFLGYLLANLLFAGIYLGVGMEHFARPGGSGLLEKFLDAFFFSAQTLTTVGYGHISPLSHLASAVAALESLLGLLTFALATGLLYGRFSRPHAQIRFSRHAVVAPYRAGTGFMFRFVNRRSNQLIEVEANVVLSRLDPETGARTFRALALERSRINLFPANWTVVHPIDDASPLAGLDAEALRASHAEFIVLVKAFDDTFSQTLFQRTSFTAEEVVWGQRFAPMTRFAADGAMEVDINLLDEVTG
ncbi:ion channel [Mesoterricola silvestris]|uniref:Inward rectifier potassium channel Irk n=1 Tax=Mesoterricola silvestris TaxID=2927979 RepID=A0AA48KBP5_9BACT|nr:ion channel [Mesoterricola silvestris]BDU72728.1 inward rectifier potassium channel Irk [Mesoterricola silvestris]